MTKDAKGRGDNAPPAKPSPIAELRRRWPRYVTPLRLLERARLPVGADKLRLAQRMIEACENCRGGLPEHVEMARAIIFPARLMICASIMSEPETLYGFGKPYSLWTLIRD